MWTVFRIVDDLDNEDGYDVLLQTQDEAEAREFFERTRLDSAVRDWAEGWWSPFEEIEDRPEYHEFMTLPDEERQRWIEAQDDFHIFDGLLR